MYFSVMGSSAGQASGDRVEFNWVLGGVLIWEGVISWEFGWLAGVLVGGFGWLAGVLVGGVGGPGGPIVVFRDGAEDMTWLRQKH